MSRLSWPSFGPGLAAIALALAAVPAAALTTQSNATGDWSAAATWTNGVPGAGDDVVIRNGHTVTLDADSAKINTLTVNSGGTLTGTVGAANTLFVGKGGGVDVTNNGSIDFVDTSALFGVFGSQPKGYVVLNKSSQWAGTGSWDLYSIDLQTNTLSFTAGTAATLGVAAPTPFANMGTVLSPTTVTWDYTGRSSIFGGTSSQVVPTTGFTQGGITTSGNGSKVVQAGTLTVNGALSVGSGTTWDTNSNAAAVVLKGNLTNNGSVSAGSSTYTFSGASAQALGGSSGVTVNNLVLNNASGLTVSRTATVNTLLTLTSGVLTTSGAGVELIAGASCLTSVARTSGWVAGSLRKTIPTGAPTCAFEVGDATAYRPITGVAFASVTLSFTITASVSQNGGKHPGLLATVLNLSKGVNRYWTMTNNGVGALFSSYSAVFNFVAGDVDAGAATGSFVVGKYATLLWSKPTVGARSATSVQITGVGSFSDFAVGENGGPDHYELALPSTALSCLPVTVTVTACSDASSPCTNAATSLSGATAALATAGATLGATSVTFNASGLATTTLSYPAAANGATAAVTLSGESVAALNARQCCPNGSSCTAANSCSSTFSTAAFIFASGAGGAAATIPAQTAGTASGSFVLRAVQTNTTTKACEAALSGATTVNWAYECNNPATCSASNLMSLNGGAATTIARNNNASVASYTSVPMSFDANGNAPFTFNFSDVGQATLWASKTVNSAPLAGSSNAFVTKPAGFTLAGIQQTASPNGANPAAASAAGARFVKAGEAFRATVTAVTSGGAATPNFGKEASPEGVLLTSALVLPSGGASGTLSNATIAGGSFSGGAATVSNLAFSEVGIITLTPSVADANYLGAGNVTGTSSGNVGRFVPAQFALSAATVTHRSGLACSPASNFSYLGENFRLGFTLTAQNTAAATTQNYTGSFAKLDLAAAASYNLAGRAATTTFTAAGGRLALGSVSGSWSNGVAAGLTVTLQATRAATAEGPFDADFGIAPVDSDGVAMAALDLASSSGGALDLARVGTTAALRYGRLQLLNAIGAADRPLALPVRAQYWNGSAWALYTLDSCTTVAASAVSFGNLRRTLTTADTAVSAGVALAAGAGTLRLAAPGGGRSGTVDVALSLGSSATDASCLQPWTPGSGDAATAGANLAYLRGAWCGSNQDKDPAARATFGQPRTLNHLLYRREIY